MPVAEPDSELLRFRMSWEEYLTLPDDLGAEWVDGEVVVGPRPAIAHAYSAAQVIRLLTTHLPGLIVAGEGGLRLPRNRLRGPDVMVIEGWPEEQWVTEPPVLVVEVLSGATRAEDTIRKSAEYLEGGVGQYWLLDPERRALDVFTHTEDGWELLIHLDDSHPVSEVVVGEHGTVPVELRELVH